MLGRPSIDRFLAAGSFAGRGRRVSFAACALLLLAWSGGVARAETNQAIGGITGLDNTTLSGGDGSGEAQLAISATDLTLVKQARDVGGNVLAPNADVALGQTLWFVLIVDNATAFPAEDVRITDLLDEAQFSYVPGSLEQTSVATGSNDAAIWAGTWVALTDALGGPDDAGSVTDSGGAAEADRVTIGAVVGQANTAVAVPGSTLRAWRFQVTVD